MTLQSELAQKLHQDCQRLHQYRSLLQRKEQLEARLPEARYRQREASVRFTEYECGGLGVILDKLRGNYGDKLESLRREASAAQSKLQELQMQAKRLDADLSQLEGTDSWGKIRQAADTLIPQEREAIFGKLAVICAQSLLSQLQQTDTALQEAQEWARPNNRIDVAPGYTAGQRLAEAEDCARQCHARMQEMAMCGITLEVHPYFQNPTGFIHSVASPFGELDRINSALGAVNRTAKEIQQLLSQLSQEETT